jgi:hypothetical protein
MDAQSSSMKVLPTGPVPAKGGAGRGELRARSRAGKFPGGRPGLLAREHAQAGHQERVPCNTC